MAKHRKIDNKNAHFFAAPLFLPLRELRKAQISIIRITSLYSYELSITHSCACFCPLSLSVRTAHARLWKKKLEEISQAALRSGSGGNNTPLGNLFYRCFKILNERSKHNTRRAFPSSHQVENSFLSEGFAYNTVGEDFTRLVRLKENINWEDRAYNGPRGVE